MKRVNFYLTGKEIKLITKLAKENDVSFSEMLRRLLDKQFEEETKKQ